MVWENKHDSSLATSHDAQHHIFNVDAPGATPDIINSMLCQSAPGEIVLLPALPAALAKGILRGIRARGRITIDRLDWDCTQGTIYLVLTSEVAQTVHLHAPSAPLPRELLLPARQQATLDLRFPTGTWPNSQEKQ